MDTIISIEIKGQKLPITGYARILIYNASRFGYFSELTGPESAFVFREGARFDMVKVIRPELVEIKTLRVL